jgi:hypothetical protein
MRRLVILAALILVPAPAAAQATLSAEAYEALAQGRTLHYTLDGKPFGSEQYFADRRSLWRFAGGACAAGRWYAEGPRICFLYEGEDRPVCWHFLRNGATLRAKLAAEPGSVAAPLVLDLGHVDDTPLDCPGPDLGM